MCAVHSALSNVYVVNQATGMQLCKQFSNFRFLAKIIYSLNIEIFAMVSSQDLGSSGGQTLQVGRKYVWRSFSF